MTCVLVTSACNYHGRHLVSELRERGHDVIGFYDRRHGDAEGNAGGGPGRASLTFPADLDLIMARPADPDSLALTVKRADAIIHLIDPVHPMDRDLLQQPRRSASTELPAMIALLRAATAAGIRRFVLQSSLMVYGEGRYIDEDGQPQPAGRTVDNLKAGIWRAKGLRGQPVAPMPSPEETPTTPLTEAAKLCLMRERLVRIWARATGAGTAGLRMGRLYGTPMNGSKTINGEIDLLLCDILRREPPLLLEDGGQTDDWLHVRDAARAMCQALTYCDRTIPPFNITTGIGHTSAEVAYQVARIAFGQAGCVTPLEMASRGTSRYLVGLPGAAEERIGFVPEYSLAAGLEDLVHWPSRSGFTGHARDMLQRLHDAADLIGPGPVSSA